MHVSSSRLNRSSRRFLHPALALRLLTSRKQQHGRRSQQSVQGLTLIECLVAIVIIALTVVAITPPIMLATASRIQSRKVEKANQVAQGELDRVRLLVERGSYALNDLPGTTGAINSATTINSFAAATGSPIGAPLYSTGTCPNSTAYPLPSGTAPVAATALIQVDVNGDCTPEYVMQVFRTPGYTPTPPAITATSVPFSFEMGVRVYAYYPPPVAFLPLDTTKASLRMGTGPLDIAGGKRRPMAVLYSKMARNDSSQSLGQLCIQNGGNTAANCPY